MTNPFGRAFGYTRRFVLTYHAGRETTHVLIILRKEVIQPQVPLRLPCYDLVPITGLTFGRRSGLRVLPAFVT